MRIASNWAERVRRIFTVGHSHRDWDAFAAILVEAGIEVVADVRRYAASHRHPQFAGAAMLQGLAALDIDYRPMPSLGGRREPRPDSVNTGWRQPGFRGYADYMQTAAFADARAALAEVAGRRRTVFLCAEANWRDCHRGLIADAFAAEGWEVVHLLAADRRQIHSFTDAVRLVDGRLDYSAPASAQGELF